MSHDKDYTMVTVSGKILATTDRAILFTDGEAEVWLAKAQVGGLEPPILEDEEVDIEIPEWLADRENL